MAEELLLVLSTFPDAETAQRIAHQLVAERLAACANIFPQIESFYWWEGKIEDGAETLVFLKTTLGYYKSLELKLRSLPPYKLTESIEYRASEGLPEYLQWVMERCSV
jgi:periplasmic divalent cation tolerance protein